MERKIKLKKDSVVKEVPENIVSLYEHMGWTKVDEISQKKSIIDEQPSKKFLKGNR